MKSDVSLWTPLEEVRVGKNPTDRVPQNSAHVYQGMPDALSKTVPIWCAVFNRLLFPDLLDAHKLYTPPKCVSSSEHSQMEDQLDGFVNQLQVGIFDQDHSPTH